MRKTTALFCSAQIVASITSVTSISFHPARTLQGQQWRSTHRHSKFLPKALASETGSDNMIIRVDDIIQPVDDSILDSVINSTLSEALSLEQIDESAENCDCSLQTNVSVATRSDVQFSEPGHFDDDLWAKSSASVPSDLTFKAFSLSGRKKLKSSSSMNKCLAFLAGVADVLCFNRHGCYANMMTGNTIKLASASAGLNIVDSAFFSILIFSYIIGFSVYRLTDQIVQNSANDSISTVYRAEDEVRSITPSVIAPLVFVTFAFYDILFKLAPQRSRWFVPILSIGSAAVNAAGIESTGSITCMMTGNLQKIGNQISDVFMSLFLGGPKPTKDKKPTMIVMFFTLGIFLANAAARLCNLAESVTRTGTFLSSFIIALKRLPHFAILGGIYSILLTSYSGPIKFKSPMQRLKELS